MEKFQTKIDKSFRCDLCLKYCVLSPGEKGFCIAREATEDGIHLEGYGRISTMFVDPIEKKPIFHFSPNTKVLSIGGQGCNLRCEFCQNFKIAWKDIKNKCKYFSAGAIANMASAKKCSGICFTYNEPTIYYEFLSDLADKCKNYGIFLAINTNAFVPSNVWEKVCDMCDVMNIDWKLRYSDLPLKNANYNRQILSNIKYAIEREDVHVEISIPVYGDITRKEKDAILHFFKNISYETPIHLLKIFPTDNYTCESTNDDVLFSLRKELIADLPFVYIGNVFGDKGDGVRDTICPSCKNVVVERHNLKTKFIFNTKCKKCESIIRYEENNKKRLLRKEEQ